LRHALLVGEVLDRLHGDAQHTEPDRGLGPHAMTAAQATFDQTAEDLLRVEHGSPLGDK
jgi:hypothetical protein